MRKKSVDYLFHQLVKHILRELLCNDIRAINEQNLQTFSLDCLVLCQNCRKKTEHGDLLFLLAC